MRRAVLVGGVLVGALALVPSLSASAAAFLPNGDFETGALGAQPISGWTALDQFVDLGATSIAGCPSTDTSSYTSLRGYAVNARPLVKLPVPVGSRDELLDTDGTPIWVDITGSRVAANAPGGGNVYYGRIDGDRWGAAWTDFYVLDENSDAVRVSEVWRLTGSTAFADALEANLLPIFLAVPDPSVRADFTGPADDATFWRSSSFDVRTVEDDNTPDDLAPDGTSVLQLSSSLSGAGYWGAGYVAHGPAVYSEPFTTTGPRTVSLDWMASGAAEDYHVLAYVLDTETCAQTELLDSTGRSSAWSTASAALPDAGTYRVVVVAGSYDADWNNEAGVYLDVDDVRVTPVVTGAAVSVEPLFATGATAASAGIQLSGGGLQPGSAWSAELHSTPVPIADGVADADGSFWHLASLPPSVEAGQHRIVLSGTAADGSALADTVYVTVSAAGTVSYLSLDGPEGTSTGGTTTGGTGSAAPASTTTSRTLAETGVDAPAWLAIGGGLVAAGAGALMLLRRKGRGADA